MAPYSLVGFHLPQERHVALLDQVLPLLRGCPGPKGYHDPPGNGEDSLALAGGRQEAEDDLDHINNILL